MKDSMLIIRYLCSLPIIWSETRGINPEGIYLRTCRDTGYVGDFVTTRALKGLFEQEYSKRYMQPLVLVMTFIIITSPACCSLSQGVERYLFKISNLDLLLHNHAITAILKGKANTVLREVRRDDVVVFSECIRNKTSPLLYSKCLVALVKSRDRIKASLNGDTWTSNIVDDLAGFLRPPMISSVNIKLKEKPADSWRKQQSRLRHLIMRDNLALRRPLRANNVLSRRITRSRRRSYASPFNNIEKLQRIQRFLSKMEYCNNYFSRLKLINENVLSSYGYKANFETKYEGLVEEIMKKLQDVLQGLDFEKVSVLSPKILAIFPSSKRQQLLSPEIFNFQNTGILPLPQLFRLISSSDSEALFWVELMLEVVGAPKKLDSFLVNYSAEMTRLDSFIYPKILDLEQKEYLLEEALDASSAKQKKDMDEIGYTFLNKKQARLLFDSEEAAIYDDLSDESRDKKLEERIQMISQMRENDIQARVRRQAPEPGVGPLGRNLKILQPYAFLGNLREAPVLEGLILSPHAFVSEVLRPELLNSDILSPRAFIPTILSPQALIARVLSPSAFRLELLSPTALIAWVASPEALIADILSPRVLEPRVASPEFLTVQILSPSLASPKFGSDDTLAFNVLSPNILSPRFDSKEKMVVEILSPHILGGGHQPTDQQVHNQP